MWGLAQATALTPGTPVSGSLSPANETDLYQFDAAAGDRFYFDVQARSGTSSAWWLLIDPYGNVLFISGFNTTSGDVDTLTLPRSGRYTLLIEGRMLDTGSNTYTFNVQPVTISSTALTLGSPVNGSLSVPGESDQYTFTLAEPARLAFDAQSSDGRFKWNISRSTGTAIAATPFNDSDGGGLEYWDTSSTAFSRGTTRLPWILRGTSPAATPSPFGT